VLAAIGIDAVRHVDRRAGHLALAALPLMLAAHQIDEAFVWWGLQGHVPAAVGQVATWVYLLFAFVVLPIYLPATVRGLEPPGWRRTLMGAFTAGGAAVAAVLLVLVSFLDWDSDVFAASLDLELASADLHLGDGVYGYLAVVLDNGLEARIGEVLGTEDAQR